MNTESKKRKILFFLSIITLIIAIFFVAITWGIYFDPYSGCGGNGWISFCFNQEFYYLLGWASLVLLTTSLVLFFTTHPRSTKLFFFALILLFVEVVWKLPPPQFLSENPDIKILYEGFYLKEIKFGLFNYFQYKNKLTHLKETLFQKAVFEEMRRRCGRLFSSSDGEDYIHNWAHQHFSHIAPPPQGSQNKITWKAKISLPFPEIWPPNSNSQNLIYYLYATVLNPSLNHSVSIAAPWGSILVEPPIEDEAQIKIQVQEKHLKEIGTQENQSTPHDFASYKYKIKNLRRLCLISLNNTQWDGLSSADYTQVRKFYCTWIKENPVISKQIQPIQKNFFDWLDCPPTH